VVGVATAGVTHAEVEVRAFRRAHARRADGADERAGRDPLALTDTHRGQVQIRRVE